MQPDGDEDAWRAIVDNYGERVELDVDPVTEAAPESSSGTFVVPPPDPFAVPPLHRELPADDEERFVPPVPPPLPYVPPDRMLAWTGVFGSPAVLLVCLVLGVSLVPWLAYLLVGSFIGGFVYLVATMERGPADPWDDGARL